MRFKAIFGYDLDLENPKGYKEKLQWLKLYDRKPLYTTLVDKYEVKKYIADLIGEEYVIKTLGIYDKFDDIDFEKLPNQFVMKCTHDSGGIVICKDKTKLDINDELGKKVSDRLNRRNINLDSYLLELIQKDIDSKIYFNKDLSFDYASRKLYIRNEEIFLKPYEYKVLKLLVDNKNEIVKIEDFQSLWEKEMTRFSLRNYIKQIRDKTYPELIVNSSNVGYKLIIN